MADQGTPRADLWSSDLTLELLGPVRLIGSDGRDRTPKSRKTRALLVVVALAKGPLSRARLIDLLWGDRGEEQAKGSLRQALYELRELTASDHLRADRETISLGPKRLDTDVATLARLSEGADARGLAEALGQVDQPLLATLDDLTPEFDEWLRQERSRLSSLIIEHGVSTGQAALAKGDAQSVRVLADRLTPIDDLCESVVRMGIEADLAVADRSSAARRYERLRERMREELGIEPSEDFARMLTDRAERTAQSPGVAPAPVKSTPRAAPPRPNRWMLLAGLGLVLIMAALLFWRVSNQAATAAPTVAVLPFEQRGQSQAYFASGVSDEILNLLSHQARFTVLGRMTSEQVRAAGSALDTARQLGITHILDGSVTGAGDKVLVIARLTRVSDGAQLWSERYERKADDIFAVQGDIARAVAGRLARSLGPTAVRVTDPQVYDRYLAARQLVRERREPTLAEAARLLREAIRLDPNYAPALAELAQVTMLLADHPVSYGSIPVGDARREAEAFARRAIALDPNLGDAHAALGFLTLRDASAEPLFRKAVELAPQRSEFHRWHGQSLNDSGRYEEALAAYRRAVEIDPLWGLNYQHLVGMLNAVGRPEEARQLVRRFLSLSTNERENRLLLLSLARSEWRFADAYRIAAALYRQNPHERQMRFVLASTAGQLGQLDEALGASAGDPLGRAVLRKDWASLVRIAEGMGAEFWDIGQFWSAHSRLVEAGRGDVLVRLYRSSKDSMAKDKVLAERIAQPTTIVALRQAGMERDAQLLLRRYRDRIERLPRVGELGFDRDVGMMILHALNGDRESALAIADRLSRTKPLGLVRTPSRSMLREPALASITTDRRFAAIDDRVRGALDKERAKVGLPAISIANWRP